MYYLNTEFSQTISDPNGFLLLKLFMYQKYWRYQIWKILILNKDCELMRMRVFEYAKFRVFEFSDYKISDLRHNCDRHSRGTKVYFTQLRPNYYHLRRKRTAFSPGMTLRAVVSGEKF